MGSGFRGSGLTSNLVRLFGNPVTSAPVPRRRQRKLVRIKRFEDIEAWQLAVSYLAKSMA